MAAASAALTVGACGSDSTPVAQDPATSPVSSPSTPPPSSESPSSPSSSSAPDHPVCAAVWRDGHVLAPDYAGCAASGGWVRAMVYHCSDGHRLVTYAHEFYAQPGHEITRSDSTLARDAAFRHLMAVCGA
ncbi:MAG: hypothetical protein JWN22_2746 [Nocardioides sp.]|nr:hypothetical protein [Nocardioides sp.]